MAPRCAGPAGEAPPVRLRIDAGRIERLCREALEQPDRHAALRFLSQALPSLETALPGLNNEGLLALHELQEGVPRERAGRARRPRRRGRAASATDALLRALGFGIERIDNLTSLLRGGDRRTALAVMLRDGESPEAGNDRFNSLSPVSYALKKADDENLPWVMLTQGGRLRLYATATDAGVGRRGRTETYIECQPSLLAEEQLPYLWLLYSAEALAPEGSLHRILEDSQRFAGDLAERLRERIYDRVVPALAAGIVDARRLDRPSPAELARTYEMALTVLFRLLFIAYAEDRDLLPYRSNDAYRRRSLKQKAQELARRIAEGTPVAEGDSHWREAEALWRAVARGNPVPMGRPGVRDGGLFSDDPDVSPAGAALSAVALPNETFETALRHLLTIETPEGAPGPVDFRSLGVREFGTVYEGLLESGLALADTDLALDRRGAYAPVRGKRPVAVARGEVYLHNRSGARKSSGSYYTKPFAVEHLLDGALEPALDDHFARLDAMDDTAAAEAFFDFRVADIAMGSGHFLVGAIDRIEKRMADWLAGRPLPGVRRELAALRAAALGGSGESAGAADMEDGRLLRRSIARRCIYGVDLNALSGPARPSRCLDSHLRARPAAVVSRPQPRPRKRANRRRRHRRHRKESSRKRPAPCSRSTRIRCSAPRRSRSGGWPTSMTPLWRTSPPARAAALEVRAAGRRYGGSLRPHSGAADLRRPESRRLPVRGVGTPGCRPGDAGRCRYREADALGHARASFSGRVPGSVPARTAGLRRHPRQPAVGESQGREARFLGASLPGAARALTT